MFKRFTSRELVFIALIVALSFVINILIGSGIITITGIPGSSAFVTGIVGGVVYYLIARIVPKFGSITLSQLLYGLLAVPTVMGGGPPGFLWKVPLLTFSGFVLDVILTLNKHRMRGFIIGLPVASIIGLTTYTGVYWMLGMPEFGKVASVWPIMAVVYNVLAFAGLFVGWKIYERIKKKRILQMIGYQ